MLKWGSGDQSCYRLMVMVKLFSSRINPQWLGNCNEVVPPPSSLVVEPESSSEINQLQSKVIRVMILRAQAL